MTLRVLAVGFVTCGGLGLVLASAHGCSGGGETAGGSGSASQASSATVAMSSSGVGGMTSGTTSASGTGGQAGAGGSGGIASGVDCSPPNGTPGKLKLTRLDFAFNSPILATAANGDDERFYVIERQGYIQLIKNGTTKSQFLDINNKVVTNSEFGLLGVAFHPDYVNNGRLFVHYSAAPDGTTTVEEYRRDPNDPDKADPNPVGAKYLTVAQPAPNHNGGSLEFSPKDGFLYLGLGDGGGGCDTFKTGQDNTTLLGKLLRFDISTNPYQIPVGNMPGGKPEIFDTGLRNPYRFNFDACTGDLYIGDVGQQKWEEIDVEPAGTGQRNYGWSVMEGTHCLDEDAQCSSAPACSKDGFTLPAVEYSHSGGRCSVTGGHVYRGAKIPWLRGAYLYADYCTGQVWSFRWHDGMVSDPQELSDDLQSQGGLASFGRDNQGELYVVNMGNGLNPPGDVYRIDPE